MDNVKEIEPTILQEDLLKALQFFHAKFNYDIFNNTLKPINIKFDKLFSDDDITAYFHFSEFLHKFNCIVFNVDYILDNTDKEVSIDDFYHLLTILLHEMIHQYCYENNIKDIDEDGTHNKDFIKYANKFGLDTNGYRIKKELQENIEEDIFHYFCYNPSIRKFLEY